MHTIEGKICILEESITMLLCNIIRVTVSTKFHMT